MNFSKYGSIYSAFHGCTSFRIENDMIVLDFASSPWETWFASRLHQSRKVSFSVNHPFLQALKIFYKTEAPCSVFCKDDSWTVLLGNERIVIPFPDEGADVHLYATPYYVRDPSIVSEYLQGIARPAYDHIYPYKNCILYLDAHDQPNPGGCYFDKQSIPILYRLCFLSREPVEYVTSLATEWKTRRNVLTIPFLTKETVAVPKFIDFKPIREPDLPETSIVSSGYIQKRASLLRPHCLIQDVLKSYYRTHGDLNRVGLLIQWPLRLIFEGARASEEDVENDTEFVALSINGYHPQRVLCVRYPYERYVLYNFVPDTLWTSISFVPNVLQTPADVVKVSVDSVVLGFVYQNGFYCFSEPMLEGRPSWSSESNVDKLLNTAITTDSRVRIIETFRYDHERSLHRVHVSDIPFSAWCLTSSEDAHPYPKQLRLPPLVREWLDFFKLHYPKRMEQPMAVDILKLALVLARHKICFKTKIETRSPCHNRIHLSSDDIELVMDERAVDFVNSSRLEENGQEDSLSTESSRCTIA